MAANRKDVIALLRQLEQASDAVEAAGTAAAAVRVKNQAAADEVNAAQATYESALKAYDALFAQVKSTVGSVT